MSRVDTITAQLGLAGGFEERHGARWTTDDALDVRKMASLMKTLEARFITMTAQARAEQTELTLTYHWDLDGEVVSFVTHLAEKKAVSIFDLCPAADWIEREISDLYEVEWVNRPHEPLLIRAGAPQGVNLREED